MSLQEQGLGTFIMGSPMMHNIKGITKMVVNYILSEKKKFDTAKFFDLLKAKMGRTS